MQGLDLVKAIDTWQNGHLGRFLGLYSKDTIPEHWGEGSCFLIYNEALESETEGKHWVAAVRRSGLPHFEVRVTTFPKAKIARAGLHRPNHVAQRASK